MVESYMKFGLDEKHTYLIEKADVLRWLPSVKVCECVALIKGRICLIEAKSSAPSPKNKQNFDDYIYAIVQKFIDTLLLFNAIRLGRHEVNLTKELPDSLLKLSGKEDYVLYLIIHGHKDEWMVDIQDSLKMRLGHVLRAWGIEDINLKAINHETAKKLRIIESYFPVEELKNQKKVGKTPEELENIAKEWLQAH